MCRPVRSLDWGGGGGEGLGRFVGCPALVCW